jgi:hypothetical protein
LAACIDENDMTKRILIKTKETVFIISASSFGSDEEFNNK